MNSGQLTTPNTEDFNTNVNYFFLINNGLYSRKFRSSINFYKKAILQYENLSCWRRGAR